MSATLRQSANLLAVVAMILASNVHEVFGVGRSIAEQADRNDTLLVPWAPAFAIWGPIFLGLIAYAVIQALPSNRHRPIFERTGWWTALAMGMTAVWGLAASLLGNELSRWATSLVFVPVVWGAVRATERFSEGRGGLTAVERWLCLVPVSLYAGWVGLAIFLNWAQLGVHTPLGLGLSETVVCLIALAAALAFAVWRLHRNRGEAPYAFAALWGLAFLAYARFAVDDANAVIGSAAVGGFLVVLSVTVAARRRRRTPFSPTAPA